MKHCLCLLIILILLEILFSLFYPPQYMVVIDFSYQFECCDKCAKPNLSWLIPIFILLE